MRISDRLLRCCTGWSVRPACFALALCLPAAGHAFDVKEGAPQPLPKGSIFKSVTDAVREGLQRLKSGDPGAAIGPLTFAAEQGNDIAEWRLGRMYADSEGVRRDDLKAYQHFSQVVSRGKDIAPDAPESRIVAQSFVALGRYHLVGIEPRVKKDPARAIDMFHYAATYFDDAEAQYSLGRLYAEGLTGPRELQTAARWYHLAAEKGHIHAQARLGQLMFNGDGVPRQVPRGLMWMQSAAKRADATRDAWVIELNDRARARASEDERRLSDTFLRKFERTAQR